jgi:hypothetical protein
MLGHGDEGVDGGDVNGRFTSHRRWCFGTAGFWRYWDWSMWRWGQFVDVTESRGDGTCLDDLVEQVVVRYGVGKECVSCREGKRDQINERSSQGVDMWIRGEIRGVGGEKAQKRQ